MQTVHCQAPGKLLLTGEHAVLNGIPALSLALNCQTHAQLSHSPNQPDAIEIDLIDYQQQHLYPFPLWESLALECEARYQNYLNHHLAIHTVLQSPADLILVTFLHFHQLHPLKKGLWHLKLHSEIWQGRGLGSSASVIISLLSALNHAHHHPLSLLQLKDLAQTIENRQHGQSSGVDTHTVLLGGLIQYQLTDTNHAQIDTLPQRPFKGYLIDSGKPDSTTGECVTQVQQQFPKEHPIWQQFAAVSQQIRHAWRLQEGQTIKQAIRRNQTLLEEIGVVPTQVQQFIQQLHQETKTAAKICGAGSIKGDKAGVILCLSPQPPEALCQTYGYRWQPIHISQNGVQCHTDT